MDGGSFMAPGDGSVPTGESREVALARTPHPAGDNEKGRVMGCAAVKPSMDNNTETDT